MDETRLGGKIRMLRRRAGVSQAKLAADLGISAAYLNLIEQDKRRLTATLLLKLAHRFDIDPRSLSGHDETRLRSALLEALADPLFDELDVTTVEVEQLVAGAPLAARALAKLYDAYRSIHEAAASLSSRLTDDLALPGVDRARLPAVEVTTLIERHQNHFPELEERAEALWAQAELRADDLWHGMVRHLSQAHGVRVEVAKAAEDRGLVRRGDRTALVLSESLPSSSRLFQTAYHLGLLSQPDALSSFARHPDLTTAESRALCRVAMANYFAGALLMPYAPFLGAARETRYDIELLQNRFGTSFEQVCHRLTTLRRPGQEGVPFFFARSDIAGNISKWFSTDEIHIPRFGGSCPRWSLHTAFLTPGRISVQLSRRPNGKVYFSVSRTVSSGVRGYHQPATVHAVTLGCAVEHAHELVYSDQVDLSQASAAVPVGMTCRLCDEMSCEQRVFSNVHHPLQIDDWQRGASFFTPTRR